MRAVFAISMAMRLQTVNLFPFMGDQACESAVGRLAVMEQGGEDRDLLRAIAHGDQAAMRALFARHHLRVHRFILRMIGNEASAEDVTNEVFLGVWRNAAGFDGRAAVTTWILSIAHKKAVSAMRKRRECELDEETAHRVADDADDPEVSVQKLDKGQRIRACMDRLSADHRTIIDLVYYHERSIPEIAEILDIPEGTVKTRMFHARRKLAEHLAAAGLDRGWP